MDATESPHQSGRQKTDPRVWQRWEDLFGKLKRLTDDLNRDKRCRGACNSIQDALNSAFEVFAKWRRQ